MSDTPPPIGSIPVEGSSPVVEYWVCVNETCDQFDIYKWSSLPLVGEVKCGFCRELCERRTE